MSEGTYFGVKLKKDAITSNEALVGAFMKYLGCFDNPRIWEVLLGKVGERFGETTYKLGDTSNHVYDNLPRKAVHDFLKKAIADNPGVEFDGIRSYGLALFDADKYGFPADTIIAGRNGLNWQGLSPGNYGLDSKTYGVSDGVWDLKQDDRKAIPLIEVQRMLFDLFKRIIESFDPVLLTFRRENLEELWQSTVFYFRDPYLFCLDLKPGDDVNDVGIVKKLNEIKSVLSLSELERILNENSSSCNYEVWKSSYGGIGILGRLVYERPSKGITSGMAALRRVVRERGIDLPEGEIEKWAGYEEDFIRDMEKRGKGKG
ncbi:hypothetical protein HYU16_01125 [Candidatus Woesearchaeota archaeon]|nr:hypothetical protein [Candidatus Woesearchaeota archaeon]